MKSKIILLALFASTAAMVAFYPYSKGVDANQITANGLPPIDQLTGQRPKIEAVFVLDTTGSMSGMINAAKEKIWSIATSMASANQAPEIKIGLIAYRDRGDNYVTHTRDLSADLDSMYAYLMEFKANGGGDGPESVNQALHDAVNKMSWSPDQNAYKVIFLIGDAPPHMDYQNDVKYPQTLKLAQQKGIIVNAIQCGQEIQTTKYWKQIAQLGQGRYFQVEQAGSAVAITTPFDKEIAKLSVELDKTRLYYGSAEEKANQQSKMAATEKLHASSSVESRARRATFNLSKSGKENFLGEGELIDDVTSGKVDLSSIDKEKLPASMQSMAPKAQQALIEEQAGQRKALRDKISELAQQRSGYLKKRVEETADTARLVGSQDL